MNFDLRRAGLPDGLNRADIINWTGINKYK